MHNPYARRPIADREPYATGNGFWDPLSNTTNRLTLLRPQQTHRHRYRNDVYYILSDHLGSTSVTLNAAGNQHSTRS